MKPASVHCEACGATLAPGVSSCRVCGRDNKEHLARLEGSASPGAEPQAGPASRGPASSATGPAGPPGAGPLGQTLSSPASFKPARRVPAPLRAARASPRFTPVVGRLLEDGATPPPGSRSTTDEQDVLVLERQEDITPSWLYGTILAICVVGFFFSFVWWASPSDIMTPMWRLSFLILMGVFFLVGLVVSVRLSRKEKLTAKAKVVAAHKAEGAKRFAVRRAQGAQAYAVRRKQGMVNLVHQTRSSVQQTGASLKASGTHFREGFHGDAKPNFLVKMLRGVVRFVVWTYLKVRAVVVFVLRVVLWVLRLVYMSYVLVVRLGWVLYRSIVEPVLLLAYRMSRWVVGVAYKTARGTLRLAWRIFYWLVRRWPLVYLTQTLEEPVRVHVSPPLMATDVFVSDFLKVKVREPVQQTAAPTVEAQRLSMRTKRAEGLLELQEVRQEELAERAVIVPPEERYKRWQEKRRQAKQEKNRLKQEAKQAKLDEKAALRALKQARKDAAEEYKNRLKSAKESGTKLSKEEKKALEEEVLREFLPEEALATLDRKKSEKEAKKQQPEKEEATHDDSEADRQKEQEKEQKKMERAREKEEAKRARKEKAEAKKEAKREKEARKQAQKDAKPILKGRLRKMKKEGKKPTKEETTELEERIVEELTAKILGRAPGSKGSADKPGPGDSEMLQEGKEAKGEDEAKGGKDQDPLDKKELKRRQKEEKARAKEEAKRAKQEEKERKKKEKAEKADAGSGGDGST